MLKFFKKTLALAVSLTLAAPTALFGANHREAPITALDTKADITDFFAFVSYDHPDRVTFILDVDPFLNPSNGPNYFPFDPNILYEVKVDNTFDAKADITFQFRFNTEYQLPNVFTGYVGAGNGLNAPANSPAPVAPGTPIVPPAITSLTGPGSEGLNIVQTYSVTMIKNGRATDLGAGQKLIALPTNVGPRTMPDYAALAQQAIYELPNSIRVFAGTVDDPFYIDLGAAFDSLNGRTTGTPAGGPPTLPLVLTSAQDASTANNAPDAVSGFNVNSIAIEVPITLLTQDGSLHKANDPKATIGAWGTTSRPQATVRRSPLPALSAGPFRQVQRMGNPLINELLVGTGFKDRFSMDQPVNDSQFANFFLDPLPVRVINAIYGIPIPPPPRTDLLPLVTYAPPIAAPGTPAGPVADLLRLNTGVPPTPVDQQSRLGVLGGDPAGFPNGRRPVDDVTDVFLRVGAGVLIPAFNKAPYNLLGDGVNSNDEALSGTFPFLGLAWDGRDSRHRDPGEEYTLGDPNTTLPVN